MTPQELTHYGLLVLAQRRAWMYGTEQDTRAQVSVRRRRVRLRHLVALLTRSGYASSGAATRRAGEGRGTAG
jgi:hypothetical protein